MDGHPNASPSRGRLAEWLRAHAPELLFALLLLAVLPMRDLWAPDEPDFAQCVKEMRLRGDWLLPYLNGVPYSEKPILYYWVMKGSSVLLDALTGGLGFAQGVAAWALRLPSVIAAVAFLSAFRRWAVRFLEPGTAEPAALVLATTPLWFWQAQFIQIDMLFSALLAWSWLAWLGGYLLLRGHSAEATPGEHRRWFLKAYFWLALAFLAKGPLAPVLSVLVLAAFLTWQKDLAVLRRAGIVAGLCLTLLLVAPWYVAAGLKGGAHYAYELIIFQNFQRATHAWDHIQPWWRYFEYLLGDFFPWVLLLPAFALAAAAAGAGGAKVQAQLVAFRGLIRLMALALGAGTVAVAVLAWRRRSRRLVPAAALSLGLLYLVGGTWGFRLLDPQKSYRRWTVAVQPLIAGRQVFYWQTIRSGVMVYTDHLMPELRRAEALEALDPEARLVAQRSEWEQDAWGMTPALRGRFEVLLAVPTGGGEILLLRRRP
ncbi:ArnT family glycosyltransferase [Geothrix paludis]|uniref:ArnT family glycosyltransferase n=1 Tax=Geothrix paludis TaxID=2922722 RepID=UPI001FADC1EC|nr:hypothetical protein [Geothrix paludis]